MKSQWDGFSTEEGMCRERWQGIEGRTEGREREDERKREGQRGERRIRGDRGE